MKISKELFCTLLPCMLDGTGEDNVINLPYCDNIIYTHLHWNEKKNGFFIKLILVQVWVKSCFASLGHVVGWLMQNILNEVRLVKGKCQTIFFH